MNTAWRFPTLWGGAVLALSLSPPASGQEYPSGQMPPTGTGQFGPAPGSLIQDRSTAPPSAPGQAEPGTSNVPGTGAGAPDGSGGYPSPYGAPSPTAPTPDSTGFGPTAPSPAPAMAGAGGGGAEAATAPAGGAGTASPSAGSELSSAGGALATIGDQSPFMFAAVRFPPLPGPQPLPGVEPPLRSPFGVPNATAQLLFRQTSLKIADNQSPRPQDRVYFNYNYFNNFNGEFNKNYRMAVSDIKVDHYVFGFEKTFLDGAASIGLRLPLNNVRLNSMDPRIGTSSTSLNDLSVYAKFIIAEDQETGSLISAGIDINTPTGPGQFAGSQAFKFYSSTVIQPFVGYVLNSGKWYLQGFSSVAVPTNDNDSVMLFNDIGLGYRLYEDNAAGAILTALVPTVEFHVNTPLSHRGIDPYTLTGGIDVVNLTAGCHARIGERLLLTTAYVRPMTGPTVFEYEVVAMANIFFGKPRSRSTPPVVGGF